MRKLQILFVFGFVLVVAQCGGDAAKPNADAPVATTPTIDAESCNQIKFKSECSEFTGAAKTVAKTLCEEGTHAESACPAGSIGKCNAGKGIAKVYYAAGSKPYNVGSAKGDCAKMEGEFQ